MHLDLSLPMAETRARLGKEDIAATLIRLIAGGAVRSRAALGRATGLSRTTIDGGIATLRRIGAVAVTGLQPATGRGRPGEVLEVDPQFGVVLVADCGASIARLGVFDLGQRLLAQRDLRIRIDLGPQKVLETVAATFGDLLDEAGATGRSRTVIMGLPGPVDYRAGTVVRPPIMPGWDGYPTVSELERLLGCTAHIENDVNLRALGEACASPPTRGPVLYLKVGAGIGVGIVDARGALVRGADGSAGDVGHIRVPGQEALCVCGARGCLEAVSSIRAIGMALGCQGDSDAAIAAAVIARVGVHDPAALEVVTERSLHIGEVMVSLIHLLNPERIVIGGALALASDNLLATVRSVVYRRALPLATRTLVIARPELGELSGLAGGLALGMESAFSPDALHARIYRPTAS